MFSRDDGKQQSAKRLKEKNEALTKALGDIETDLDVSSDIAELNNLRSRLDSPTGVAELFQTIEEEGTVLQQARQTVKENQSNLIQIQTELLRKKTEAQVKRSELVKELEITSNSYDEVMKTLEKIGDRPTLIGSAYDNAIKEKAALDLRGNELSSQLKRMDEQLPEEQMILRQAEQVAKDVLEQSIKIMKQELKRDVHGELAELDIEHEESRAETIEPVVSELEKLKNAVDLADRNLKAIQAELHELDLTINNDERVVALEKAKTTLKDTRELKEIESELQVIYATYDKKGFELSDIEEVALSELDAARSALKSAQVREEYIILEQSIVDAQTALDMHTRKIEAQILQDEQRGPELDRLIKLKEKEISDSFVKVFKKAELDKLTHERDAILPNQQLLLETKLELSAIVEDRKRLLEVVKKDEFEDDEDDEEDDEDEIDAQVKHSDTIKTVYQKELPEIQKGIVNKKSALARVETAIADQESKAASVVAQEKVITHLNNQIKESDQKIKTLESQLKQSTDYCNALEPKGFFGRLFEAFKHLFVEYTAYDNAVIKARSYEYKLNAEKDTRSLQHKNLIPAEIDLMGFKQAKAKSEQELSAFLVSDGGPDEIKSELEQLNKKLGRDAEQEKLSLIERCKPTGSWGLFRDKEQKESVAVKASLKTFLKSPTENNLTLLQKTMGDNPNYIKNKELTQLLRDASSIYSEIVVPDGPLLTITPEVKTDVISTLVADNQQRIVELKAISAVKTREMAENTVEIREMMQQLQPNIDALRTSYELLRMMDNLLEKAEQDDREMLEIVRPVLLRQIERIKANLPDMFHDVKAPDLGRTDKKLDILRPYETKDNKIPEPLEYAEMVKFISRLSEEDQNAVNKEINIMVSAEAERTVYVSNFFADLPKKIPDAGDYRDSFFNNITDLTTPLTLCIKDAVSDPDFHDDGKVQGVFRRYTDAISNLRKKDITADEMNSTLVSIEKILDDFDPRIAPLVSDAIVGFKISIKELRQEAEVLEEDCYFKDRTPYTMDSKFSKLPVSTLEALNQTLASEIALNTTEASKLEALNADIMPDGQVSEKGEAMLQGMLSQLSQDCERKITSYKQPFSTDLNREVRLALKDFINRPTQEHMDSCIAAMEKDKTYLKNDKLVGFIERAGVLYPEVAKAHGAVVEKALSQATEVSSVNQRFKRELDGSREDVTNAATGDKNVDGSEIQDTSPNIKSPKS